MVNIPDKFQNLLRPQTKAFAMLATIMKNGTPQVTPVWFDWDGENIIINTARGRVKDRNLSQRPAVSIAIVDPENPYRYIQLRGKVVDSDEKTGWEVIDHLSQKYHGTNYPRRPGEVRVTYKIHPENINTMG